VKVIDSAYTKLAQELYTLRQKSDSKAMADCRAKILRTAFKQTSAPRTPILVSGISKCNYGDYPGARKLSATLAWTPSKDSLQVKADVTDAFFKPGADSGSQVDLFISPSGTRWDTSQITITPSGTQGKAKVSLASSEYGPSDPANPENVAKAKTVSARWKKTRGGYSLDVKIPWRAVRGYQAGWNMLPVDAVVTGGGSDNECKIKMGALGDPVADTFTYVGLKAK